MLLNPIHTDLIIFVVFVSLPSRITNSIYLSLKSLALYSNYFLFLNQINAHTTYVMVFYQCNVTGRVVCASKQLPFALVPLGRTKCKLFVYTNVYCHDILRKYHFIHFYVYLFHNNCQNYTMPT